MREGSKMMKIRLFSIQDLPIHTITDRRLFVMDKLINPIIPGYYPDPSICRVGDDFYLACSSFEMFPGIPIFHSKDLVHWEQIANAMTADNGFHVEANVGVGGVMAPTIRYYDGTFYIINANFADSGNYIVTAKDPAGPWSLPHWMDDVPGIDASIFFDHDGQCYVMGTGNVWDNGAGVMERGIWVAKYDIENFRLAGEPFTIWNSALRGAGSPEAPHLYHIGEYYYLMIAEGGTEHYHSVTVARSKELFSFFEGNPANPVLTHRHMGFKCPIINVGHADFVDLPDGSWYAVMLASRLIEGECKNIGRETFICPVIWERDWPVFTPETGKVEWEYDAPNLPQTVYPEEPSRDDFDDAALPMYFIFWGRPYQKIWDIRDSKLSIKCIRQRPDEELKAMSFNDPNDKDAYVAFIGRRQREINVTAETKMHFIPSGDEAAGLAVIQALNHELLIERCTRDGKQLLRAVCVTADYDLPPYIPGFTSVTKRETIAETEYSSPDVTLKITMSGEEWHIYYGENGADTELCAFDGRILNPEKVGCMTGTMIGMFATGNGTDSENAAEFDYFELKQPRVTRK